MVQRRLTRTNVPRLGRCLAALCALAKSRGPHRSVLVERHIDDYLRTDPFSLAHALERLRRAIHYEELERREGEDWSIAKDYVRSLHAQDGVAAEEVKMDALLQTLRFFAKRPNDPRACFGCVELGVPLKL